MTAWEFIQGAYSFAKARIRPTAPRALAEARFNICQSNACGFFQAHPTMKCRECGCFLPEKTLDIKQFCRLGHW